jgi:hypothetical protein
MKRTADVTAEWTLTDEDVLALVRTRSRRFQRQIRFRDWREWTACALVAVMIAPIAVRGPWLARAGALVILAGLVLVVVRLWRASHLTGARAMDVTLPVATALRVELREIDAQIVLLDAVGWWYVAPLVGGSVVLVAGLRGLAGWYFTFGYAVFAALLSWIIIALNRRTVRRVLQPKRDDVAGLLAQIES